MSYRTFAASRLVPVAILIASVGCGEGPTDPPITEYRLHEPVVIAPTANTVVAQGKALPCLYVVQQDNPPAGAAITAQWFRDEGVAVDCGALGSEPKVLIQGSPPVSATEFLSVGTHTLWVEVCSSVNGDCKISRKVTFEVIERPGKIIFTLVDAPCCISGPRDFWSWEEGASTPVRLTYKGWQNLTPALSPDGTILAYHQKNGVCNGLTVSDLSGNNERNLTFVNGECLVDGALKPVFSPDGQWIAFFGSIPGRGNFSAFIVRPDGSGLKQILSGTFGINPDVTWMPDGSELVTGYEVYEDGRITGVVYVRVNPLTDEVTEIYSDHGSMPRVRGVTSDGKWVILEDLRDSDRAMRLATDGSREIRYITPEGSKVAQVFVCPSGQTVCSVAGAGRQIPQVDLNGGDSSTLFALPGELTGWMETPRSWK